MKKLDLSKGDKQVGSDNPISSQKTKKISPKDKIPEWNCLFMKGRYRTISLIIVLSLIVWYLIPIQLLVFYGEDLKLDISLFNKMSFLNFGFFTAFLILLYLFLHWITNKFILKKSPLIFQSVVNGVLIFVICWVTLSGYVFPFVKTTGGMVDEINIPTNWINVIIVFVISGFITYFFYNTVARKIIRIIFLTFYLVTIPVGIINMFHLYSTKSDNSENLRLASQLSSNTNLLVISFDGVQGFIVDDILTNEPGIRSEFKDFLRYDNVISTAPATRSSIITELFGNIDMRNYSDNEKGVLEKLPYDSLLMNMEVDKSVSTSTYGAYNEFNKQGVKLNNIAPQNMVSKNNDNLILYASEMSRILTGKISGYLYPLITRRIIKPFFKLLAINDPYLNHKGESWDKEFLFEDRDYRTLIDNMHINDGTDTLVIKYFHFAHTHYPVDFDKNGQYRSDDETWYRSNQNYIGLYNQTYYALSEFVDLIKKLKELGVYDNTFLVLKSDHGKPVFYFRNYPYNLKINDHERWGYSRYRPLLMIKDIGREELSMVHLPNLVSLGDLAYTISTRFQPDANNSDIYPGLNLLDEIDPSTSPYIYLNIVKNFKSSHQFDNHITIRIDRRTSNSFLDLLKLQDSVRLSSDSIH